MSGLLWSLKEVHEEGENFEVKASRFGPRFDLKLGCVRAELTAHFYGVQWYSTTLALFFI